MSGGYIYIGGFQPHPGTLYLKAGKTTQPKARVKAYGTMVPGGLSFMRVARVANTSRAETELMQALSRIDGVEPVGGEWFRCEPLMKLAALDELHRLGGAVVQVHTHCPPPFGSGRSKRVMRGRCRG